PKHTCRGTDLSGRLPLQVPPSGHQRNVSALVVQPAEDDVSGGYRSQFRLHCHPPQAILSDNILLQRRVRREQQVQERAGRQIPVYSRKENGKWRHFLRDDIPFSDGETETIQPERLRDPAWCFT